MTEALFKHTTTAAREAALLLPARTVPVAGGLGEAPPQPTHDEIEIARLKDEIASLIERIGALQDEWDARVQEVKSAAREEAARAHVRKDAEIARSVEHCLESARKTFSEELKQSAGQLACSLAAAAVQRLAELKQDEEEWLGRVIARRIEHLTAGALVAIHISSAEEGGAVAEALKDHVRKGAALKFDPSLPAGTAKLVLRLGEIDVSPAQGAARLAQAIEQAGSENG